MHGRELGFQTEKGAVNTLLCIGGVTGSSLSSETASGGFVGLQSVCTGK